VTLDADLGDEARVADLVPRATAALGPLGLLVNNASTFERDDALDATRESWDAHIGPNLRAPFVLTQGFARALIEGDDTTHGVVVNVIDQRVWNLTPHYLSYTLTKSALWTLTQTLALTLAPRIRVAGIGPGPTLKNVRQTDAQFAAQVGALPLARGPALDEICRAVRFIVDTPSFTGQMIALDGGEHMGWAQSASGFVAEE